MAWDASAVVPAYPSAAAAEAAASLKKKGASARSWILVDSSGQGTVLDVDKYDIMHRVQVHARDLRILDPILSYPSTILGRERAIVLNLEVRLASFHGFCLVLLQDPLDDDIVPVVEELQRRLPPTSGAGQGEEEHHAGHEDDAGEDNESPFEFRALEVVLESICSFLAARTTELEAAAYPALDELTSKVSSSNLDRVSKLKTAMTRLTARVQKVRDELEQLLGDDDDMADLYLSRKLAGASSPVSGSGAHNWFPASPTIGSKISQASKVGVATAQGDENDVEVVEMLLEAYFMQIDGTMNKLTTLRGYIDDTEDYLNLQLDKHRNQLIQLELILTAATISLAIYSLVGGYFGMNIPFAWNEGHGYLFKWVAIVTGALCTVVFLFILAYARHKGLIG
ncbi:hypothetical protein MLD38_036214 [Melastoma candidum]|uniref:Uncharacterized protein n=1 Tax=Melastoma candidum TaxID=119954 RepID=A0ACB9LJ97_9MYRT|nr:hypothetical protein MLD38_036214 [Melastoma candidum]